MSLYQDSKTTINKHTIELRGLIIPKLSVVQLTKQDIQEIEVVRMSYLKRLNFLGTQDLKTWWVFDLKRPFQKYGFVIKLKNFKYNVGFTVTHFEEALEVVLDHYKEIVRDLRGL